MLSHQIVSTIMVAIRRREATTACSTWSAALIRLTPNCHLGTEQITLPSPAAKHRQRSASQADDRLVT